MLLLLWYFVLPLLGLWLLIRFAYLASFVGQPVLSIIASDPDDNRVLECAAAAKADCIISGDRHLLGLRSYHQIGILSPSQFLERFS